MDALKIVQQTIQQQNLFTINNTLLVAVSGGADSTILCNILHQLGYTIAIAHVNFMLRGEASLADEAFVTQLANTLQVPLHVLQIDTKAYATEHKLSTQVAARQIRYNFFAKQINTTTQKPYTHIVTAHNANDVVETAMMHFCKGTGIQGLTSIPIKNGNIVRPLLHCSRMAVEEFAILQSIAFVTDSSNYESYYTRNFMRNEVLPLLQQKIPTVSSNISQTVQHCNDVALLYNEIVAQKIVKIAVVQNNELHIPILKLQKEKAFATILFEIVQRYGFESAQLPEILKLFTATNSSYIASATHRIIKNRSWLLIVPQVTTQAQHVYIDAATTHIAFANGEILIQQATTLQQHSNNNIAQLNAAKLEHPLLLRPIKEGDYFSPLGMTKKKKIARFLIDLKLSKPEKEKVWVLESNQKIVWVVGYRIDDRFKVNEHTQSICLLTFKGR
jgi:tRNA(Ile)-lysidine synthase